MAVLSLLSSIFSFVEDWRLISSRYDGLWNVLLRGLIFGRMFFPECPNSIKLWKTESDRDLKKKTRALDCPMPLWNYAEMGGPKRYNEKLIKHKHLTSQQKSRPAKKFLLRLQRRAAAASKSLSQHQSKPRVCFFFRLHLFLRNSPKHS